MPRSKHVAFWGCALRMVATDAPAQAPVEPPAPLVCRLVQAQKGFPS